MAVSLNVDFGDKNFFWFFGVRFFWCVGRKNGEDYFYNSLNKTKTLGEIHFDFFDSQAEDTAKKLGVGILKLNGDAVEIQDKNLKVY